MATSGEEIDERKNIVIKLFDDDLFLAAPSDYKGRKKDADLKDLHFAKWVTLQEGFATFDGFVDAFRQTGKTPEIVAKVNDIFSMVSFVQAGLGFALLPGRMQPVFESTVKLITLAEPYESGRLLGLSSKRRMSTKPISSAPCRRSSHVTAAAGPYAVAFAAISLKSSNSLNDFFCGRCR